MTTIFVDYSLLDNHKTVALINDLSESHEIVVFSTDKEQNRLTYNERLMDLEIGADDLLLQPNEGYIKHIDLVLNYVLDRFDGHDERAIEQTATIYCNNERIVERLREEGFHCSMTGWE